MNFILSQIFGIIALAIVSIGYFVKHKSKFLTTQILANLFYASAFLMVKAYVAGIITIISIFRCIYIYISEKNNFQHMVYYLPIFILFYIIIGIVFWNHPYDFLPIITSSLFTLSFAIQNLQKMRILLIIPNTILIVYNILVMTYANALLDFIEVLVIVIAILKHHIDNKKQFTTLDK